MKKLPPGSRRGPRYFYLGGLTSPVWPGWMNHLPPFVDSSNPRKPLFMSDPENSGPIPPTSQSDMEKTGPVSLSARSEMDKTGPIPAMNKTSSIPLKKETVRVTLKANPEAPRAETPNIEGAPSVVQVGGPPAPPAAPKPPLVAAPAPTIRLKTAAGTVTGTPAPAPTVRLNTGANLAGAPTVPLATRPLTGAPTVPLTTRPLTTAAPAKGATVQLPKATVQLNPTKPLGPPTAPGTAQIGTMHVVDDEETDRAHKEATTMAVLSVLAFVASLALLWAQIDTWTGPDTAAKEIGELLN